MQLRSLASSLASASKRLLLALLAAVVLLPAQAQNMANAVQVTLPNGYLNLRSDDLKISSSVGQLRWSRQWDGHEWRFNPQWESLSHSWRNLTGSDEVVPGSDYGCWIVVDEDWKPTLETVTSDGVTRPVMVDGIAQAQPMVAARTTPFNRKISAGSAIEYPPVARVSFDYARVCPGAKAQFVDLQAIRRANQLFIGVEDGTGRVVRYDFDNRAGLEKRAVRQLPAAAAATLYTNLATGQIAPTPQNNPKGYRWSDRGGDWMDYNAQGQGVAFGDRRDNIVWLQRDDQGRLLAAVNDSGHVLLSFHYTGELLTEVKDYPLAAVAGDLPARSVQYRYDDRNRLTQVTDTRGNTLQYGYDAGNHLTRLTDQEGRIERIAYTEDTVKQRTAPDGGVTDYEFGYDNTNQQFNSKITGPATAAGRRVDDYTHSRSGNLLRLVVNGRTDTEIRYNAASRTQTETNARGFATRTTRNEYGQITEIKHPDDSTQKKTYSAMHMGITEETDELGIKAKYEYDAKGGLLKTMQAAETSDERIIEHEGNSRGQLIRGTRKGRTESNGSVTLDAVWQITYDALGNISRTIDPEGNTRNYVFSRVGALLKYTNPNGSDWTYGHDAAGNLTTITDPLGHVRSFSYDKTGNRTSSISASSKTTLMVYDAMNRCIQTANPVGGQYKLRYDVAGQVIGETDEDGRGTNIEYDRFERISRETDALDNVTTYGYQINDGNSAGMPGSLFDPTEIRFPTFTQKIRYDARERPIDETLIPTNNSAPQASTNSKTYDARGQITSETDANGNRRSYTYSGLRQIRASTDALGNTTQAHYDARGNLVEVTDAIGGITRFTYDRNDRRTNETLQLGQVTRYSYDAAGHLTERTDPAGNKKHYSYDAANRLTQVQHTQANTVVRTVTLTWNAENNLTAWSETDSTRPAGQQTTSAVLSYDDAGRKTGETVSYPNPAGGSYSLGYSYQYSLAGKKTRLTWADGTAIGYGYSAHGALQSVSIPNEGSISVNQYQWLAPALITLPGGSTQEKIWDGLFNFQGLKSKTPSQQITLTLTGGYGKKREIKTSSRTDRINGASSTRDSSYSYDSELRLTSATTNTGGLFGSSTETFGLDGLANRTAHSRTGSGAWQYDRNHRLLQRPGPGGSGTVSYVYDANGNQTQKTQGTSTTRYRYDGDNRLIEVQNGAGNAIARYGYDPMNRRVWKEQYRNQSGQALIPALRTYFLYADEGMVAEATQAIAIDANQEVSASQTPAITTQYGLKIDSEFMTEVLFIKTKNGNGTDVFAYYHGDHLGSPLQATDKAGNVLWAANYNVFGLTEIVTPSASTEGRWINSHIRLPGQYEDTETGLHYNFNRYYDPNTGRYIQSDPIGLIGGWNRYTYTGGNPINFIDPTGEIAGVDDVIIVVGAGILVTGCAASPGCRDAINGAASSAADAIGSVATSVTDALDSLMYSKQRNERLRDSGLVDLSDDEIQSLLDDPSTSTKDKGKLVTEQKVRGNRNRNKDSRKGKGRKCL